MVPAAVWTRPVSTPVTAVRRRNATPLPFQPGGEAGDGVAAFDPQLVRGMHGTGETGVETGQRGGLGGGEHAAALTHLGAGEFLQHGQGFRPSGGEGEAALMHRDADQRRDLGPDVTGTAGAAPAIPGFLAGHGDEAEIADGGADGAGLALDHHGAEAGAVGSQRMRQADDAGADDGDVVARHQAASIRAPFRAARIGRTHRANRVASSSCR
jgi:hypothetical protein